MSCSLEQRLVYRNGCLVLPMGTSFNPKVKDQLHSSTIGGREGALKTFKGLVSEVFRKKILQRKEEKGIGLVVFVQWTGLPALELTWEPGSRLVCLEELQSCLVVCNNLDNPRLMLINEDTISFVKKLCVRSKTGERLSMSHFYGIERPKRKIQNLESVCKWVISAEEDDTKDKNISRKIRVIKWDVKKRHTNTELIAGYLKINTLKFSGLDILNCRCIGRIISPSISVTRKEEGNKGTKRVKFFVDQFQTLLLKFLTFQMFHWPSYEEVFWLWSGIKWLMINGSSEKEKKSNSRDKTVRRGLCRFARSFQLEDKLVFREGSIDRLQLSVAVMKKKHQRKIVKSG